MRKRLLVICGPTAVGKTSLGIKAAIRFGGEILSADSRQVYRGLNMVTGKDVGGSKFMIYNPLQRRSDREFKNKDFAFGYYLVKGTKIWGLDIADPGYWFNVSDYVQYARLVLGDIWKRKKLPVIVGGTGMYIKALLEPPETIDLCPDWELRRNLETKSVLDLQEMLKLGNRGKFKRMNHSDRSNPRRLIRAIEIGKGKKIALHRQALHDNDSLIVGLTASRVVLHKRVDERLKALVEGGAEREVRQLLKNGIPLTNPAASSTGAGAFLNRLKTGRGKLSDKDRGEILKQWQFADHRLVRQQMTWFRHQLVVEWFNTEDKDYPEPVLKRIRDWYN